MMLVPMRMVRVCNGKSMGELRRLRAVTVVQVLVVALLLLSSPRPAQTLVVLSRQAPASKRSYAAGYYSSGHQPHAATAVTSSLTATTPSSAAVESQSQHQEPFLTVVIPAYNEQGRIGTTLRAYQSYLLQSPSSCWKGHSRILVVDDGSTDQTSAVVQQFAAFTNGNFTTNTTSTGSWGSKNEKDGCPILCLSLTENQGKGGAIAAGIAHVVSLETTARSNSSNGEDASTTKPGIILTADADGSADPSCLEALYRALLEQLEVQRRAVTKGADAGDTNGTSNGSSIWKYPALVCGYRVYNDDSNDDERDDKNRGSAQNTSSSSSSPLRQIFHWGFRTVVQILFWGTGLNEIRDTQCGSKLFTRAAAQKLYANLHLRRWSHDVEVLLRAVVPGTATTLRVGQAPVPWRDCAGSRLAAEGVVRVAATMLMEIAYCRFAYAAGWWK